VGRQGPTLAHWLWVIRPVENHRPRYSKRYERGFSPPGEKDCHMMGRRLLVTLARVTMKLDRFQTDPAPSRNREDDQAGGRFQEGHVPRPRIDGCPTEVGPQRGI